MNIGFDQEKKLLSAIHGIDGVRVQLDHASLPAVRYIPRSIPVPCEGFYFCQKFSTHQVAQGHDLIQKLLSPVGHSSYLVLR
jgi:hypothetical protein